MATLYLIRHGEPEITGVMLGQMDPPLSRRGRSEVAARLAGLFVEQAWTSPLRRAHETAQFIPARDLVELPELREIDHGDWTGKSWAEIEAAWPELAAHKSSDWLGVAAPGGETWERFLERVQSAWKMIRAGRMPAAVVGHQGVNAALMYVIKGCSPLEFKQAYGEVIQIDYD
jgi:broad specificity phosphatase PhoE